jgi:hypothetical protein
MGSQGLLSVFELTGFWGIFSVAAAAETYLIHEDALGLENFAAVLRVEGATQAKKARVPHGDIERLQPSRIDQMRQKTF